MAPPEPCPVACGRTRRQGQLMCARCWRTLTLTERRWYLRRWRDWQAGEIPLADLRYAQERAVELVRGRAA